MNGYMPNTVKTRLRQAEQHLKSGQFVEAEAVCRALLAVDPKNLPALQMLGISRAQQGYLADAEAAFRDYVALNPASAQVTSNLGNICMLRKDYDGAAKWYRSAIALMPQYAEAQFNLALALKNLGQLDASLAALRAAMDLKPNYVEAIVQTATVLLAMKDFDAAVAMADKAIAIRDNLFEAHYNRAMALLGLHRLEDAKQEFARAGKLAPDNHLVFLKLGETLHSLQQRDLATSALARAAALKPDCAEAHAALARVFLEDGWTKAALDECQKTLTLEPDNSEYHIIYGSVLADLNKLDDAFAEYAKALELAPASVEALSALGRHHLTLGQNAEAKALFERAVAIAPENIGTHLDRARIGKFVPDDPRRSDLELFLPKQAELATTDQIDLHFALGKAYDDCNDIDRAFDHFNSANALQAQERKFDEAEDAEWLAQTRKAFTKEFMAERLGNGSQSRVPVFIVGMPRSGSTLIEQIISSHPAVQGAGEVQDFYNAIQIVFTRNKFTTPLPGLVRELKDSDFVELGDTYVARLRERAPDGARITDKLLSNYNRLGLLRLALPNAVIIHCMRNPVDCCVSIYTNRFAQVHASNNDLASLGRSYRRYSETMQHWRDVLPEGSFLDIRYEDTVRDLEGTARRIVAACGLEWDSRCLDFDKNQRSVTTLSITQVRQPIYSSSMDRWRRYEKHLQPLIEALGDLGPSQDGG